MPTLAAERLQFTKSLAPLLVGHPPKGPGWLHEIKLDGYRTQLIIKGAEVRAYSRGGINWTKDYWPVVKAAATLNCELAIIDGEMVVQDERGLSDYSGLRSSIRQDPGRLVFFAFDLLHLDGADLRGRQLEERRLLLAGLMAGHGAPLALSEAIEGEGAEVFAAVAELGCEGIVSKRKGSAYKKGAWLKTKCTEEAVFEVIGAEKTSTGAPSALLARRTSEGLQFAGNAFVGLAAEERDMFWQYVEQRTAPASPVHGMKRKNVTWVEPGLGAEVGYLRGEGLLRHASLRRLIAVPAR